MYLCNKVKNNASKLMVMEYKELLTIDLGGRLRHGVICNTPKGDGHLCSIDQTIFGTEYGVNISATERDYFNDRDAAIKPYLLPLSSMTEEEAKEIATLRGLKNILSVQITDEYIDVIIDDGFNSTEMSTIWYDEIISSIEIFDWLNAHHFDYRGLIPKGLAIAVTEENNPYKE